MSLKYLVPAMSSVWLLSPPILAETPCQWRTWSSLAADILEKSPEWIPLNKKLEWERSRLEVASIQVPSRASAQYLAGQSPAADGEAEFSYEWTIESSGKIQSRRLLAQSQLDLTTAARELQKIELLRDVAIISERVEQIKHERESLEEGVKTYRALIRQFTERPALSPEQNVTSAVFKLARDETLLKLGQLQIETEVFKSQLAPMAGCSMLTLPSEHKKERTRWPEFPSEPNLANSPLGKKFGSQKLSAQAQRDEEIKRAESDLSIGPIARWNREDKENKLFFGLAASLPLGGSQQRKLSAQSESQLAWAMAEADYEQLRTVAEYRRWIVQYRNAVSILRQGFAELDVKGQHENMEKLFLAGRVNATLVIEAHRQMFEHMVSRHQIEMKAAEALWNIQWINGTLLRESL